VEAFTHQHRENPSTSSGPSTGSGRSEYPLPVRAELVEAFTSQHRKNPSTSSGPSTGSGRSEYPLPVRAEPVEAFTSQHRENPSTSAGRTGGWGFDRPNPSGWVGLRRAQPERVGAHIQLLPKGLTWSPSTAPTA